MGQILNPLQCPISLRESIPKCSDVSSFYRVGVVRDAVTSEESPLIFVSLLKALTALSALSFERKIHCELRASKMARHAVTATMSSA